MNRPSELPKHTKKGFLSHALTEGKPGTGAGKGAGAGTGFEDLEVQSLKNCGRVNDGPTNPAAWSADTTQRPRTAGEFRGHALRFAGNPLTSPTARSH